MTARDAESTTRRPWKLHPAAIPYVLCGEGGCSFGPVTMAGTQEEIQANARLIVRAVNAHDDLVAICSEILSGLDAITPMGKWRQIDDWKAKVRTALAKAKGQQP